MKTNYDIFKAFRFKVVIQDSAEVRCARISGVQKSVEIETYQEGGCNDYVHSLPKFAAAQKMVVERGVTQDRDALTKWVNDCLNGKVTRKNLTVELMDRGQKSKKWDVVGAYPVAWTAPDLDSMSSEVAFEKLEFAYNFIKTI